MRMLKAIARLRRGAKDHGLEGVLRSDAIPEPLRAAAARLATLFGSRPEPGASTSGAEPASSSDGGARKTKPVIALEQALAAKAARSAEAVHAQPASLSAEQASVGDGHAHAAGGICPFTGLRADGTPAVASAMSVAASDATLDLSLSSSPLSSDAPPGQPVEARGSAREPNVEARGSAREPNVEARGSAREPVEGAPARARKPRVRAAARTDEVRSPAREQKKAALREPKAREKNKERLAGARTVDNTSGRSATRSAAKQPRSRTQASRKKA